MSKSGIGAPPSAQMYASFGVRTLSFVIDTAIIFVMIALAIQLVDQFMEMNNVGVLKAMVFGGSVDGISSPLELLLNISAKQWAVIILCAQVVPFLYYVLFESIGLKGTPGKVVLGIEVTEGRGKRISIGTAIWRHVGRYISAVLFFLGYFMAAWSTQRQTLHDMMSNALVLRRRRPDESLRYSPSNRATMMLCGLGALAVLAVMTGPAGAVLQGYRVDQLKTKLAMTQISDVVKEVEAYARETNVWPNHIEKLGLLLDDYVGGNVGHVEVGENGVVVVTLQGADGMKGKRVVLSPTADDAGDIQWRCNGTAVTAGLTTSGCVQVRG